MNQQAIELKENNRQKTYTVKEIAKILRKNKYSGLALKPRANGIMTNF